MEVTFDKKWKELCEQEKVMKKKLGMKGTKKLKGRLADLFAASSFADIMTGRPHILKGDLVGCIALDLDGARRLVLRPKEGQLDMDAPDFKRIDSVEVVFIGDYHD